MKLKDIPNLLVGFISDSDYTVSYRQGFNKAISLMSEREITMSREKLANILFEDYTTYSIEKISKYNLKHCSCESDEDGSFTCDKCYLKHCYFLADAIISNLGTILEVKK